MSTLTTASLFKPVRAITLAAKNRLVVAPMSRVSATDDGNITKTMSDYYLAFAQGGFGIIITEGIFTDLHASRAYPNQPGLVNQQQMESWKRVVEKIKKYETKVFCQLMHAGALSQAHDHTIAPSSIQPLGRKMTAYGGLEGKFPLPKEASWEDIRGLVDGFVSSARLAFMAGFDGVEIHAANGYLLDQFLTPYLNKRQDAYGGTPENEFRIIKEIYEGVRNTVPPDFTVGVRLSEGKVNHLDYRWEEGPKRARDILQQAAKVSPSYIHIAAEKGDWMKDCMYADGSSYTSLAKEIVQAPVIANGGLHDLQKARLVLEGGHADLISIGKAALADPYWPNKKFQNMPVVEFKPEMIKRDARIKENHLDFLA
jgi:2,4-dienoyl-CoA reductase-like NADH-dependent reductase (Old Yellow Enzyme family)